MIIKTNRNNIGRIFQIAAAVIPGKTAVIPAMNFMKLAANENGIVFTVTNGTTAAIVNMAPDEYDLAGTGSACLEVPVAVSALLKSKADDVIISTDDNAVHAVRMKLDKAIYNLQGCDPRDFPDVKIETEGKAAICFKKAQLDAIKNAVAYACATNETRPVLTGVNMHNDGTKVIATATDSYRLSKLEIPVDPTMPEFNFTIPVKTLNLVCSIFAAEADIHVYADDHCVVFSDGETMIKTTLYAQSYPDTEKLIPEGFSKRLAMNRNDLLAALEMAMLLKEDGQTVVRLKMSEEDVCIETKTAERGNFSEALDFKAYEGEPLEITMSGAFLRDALKATKGDEIEICFNSPLKPFVITGETSGQLGLLLPVRTYD